MNEDFFQERARIVREIAEKADPLIKKRLLALADLYERKPRKFSPLPPTAISAEEAGG